MTLMNEITPQALYDCFREGKHVELIDVSTPIEFAERRVSFAKNLPIDSPELAAFMRERRGDCAHRLYVMCAGGVRSVKACERYPEANLVNVEGGMRNWSACGLPVATTENVVTLDRQVRIAAGALTVVGCALAAIAHPYFLAVPAFVGAGLFTAGVTNTCGMALLLAKMPWNRRLARVATARAESYSH